MRKSNNKKLYEFLIDKMNKNAIVTILALIILLICNIFIKNVFLRITFYLGFYMLINNYYIKVVNYFFAEDLKIAEVKK